MRREALLDGLGDTARGKGDQDELHARGINLHILTGICVGLHRSHGAGIADKTLFLVPAYGQHLMGERGRGRRSGNLNCRRYAYATGTGCPVYSPG